MTVAFADTFYYLALLSKTMPPTREQSNWLNLSTCAS
jgi:hypothetical protein